MSYGSAVHQAVSERDHERVQRSHPSREFRKAFDAADQWCQRYIPECLDPATGRAHIMVVGTAMHLKFALGGSRPTPDHVRARVAVTRPWVAEQFGWVA